MIDSRADNHEPRETVLLTDLWLIRHAKSSWADASQADFDRPLNGRGRRDGPRMQAWLAEQEGAAQWIWTSDAARARATADFVQAAWPDAQLIEEHGLYHADPRRILDVAYAAPEDVTRVAVVAHNPGMTWAVNDLAGDTVVVNLPTFGVAHFRLQEGQAPELSKADQQPHVAQGSVDPRGRNAVDDAHVRIAEIMRTVNTIVRPSSARKRASPSSSSLPPGSRMSTKSGRMDFSNCARSSVR